MVFDNSAVDVGLVIRSARLLSLGGEVGKLLQLQCVGERFTGEFTIRTRPTGQNGDWKLWCCPAFISKHALICPRPRCPANFEPQRRDQFFRLTWTEESATIQVSHGSIRGRCAALRVELRNASACKAFCDRAGHVLPLNTEYES